MALDRLIDAIAKTGNPTVAGLDPNWTTYPISSSKRRSGSTEKPWKAPPPPFSHTTGA